MRWMFVFMSLDSSNRTQYTGYDFKENGFLVRDDLTATKLYYAILPPEVEKYNDLRLIKSAS
jgi:hypothetical protein